MIVSLLNEGRGAKIISNQLEDKWYPMKIGEREIRRSDKRPFAFIAGFTFKRCKIVRDSY